MNTFHPFLRLPAELRLQIWEMTVEPRTVEVWFGSKDIPKQPPSRKIRRNVPHIFSPTPIPAALQTCREARNHTLYQRVFSKLAISNGAPKNSEQRYIWANLDIDTISIDQLPLKWFASVAPLIKRLRFERDNRYEFWEGRESSNIALFANAKEMYVVSERGGFAYWIGSSEYYWPCGTQNVFIINPDDGEMMRLADLEAMYDREAEENHRRIYPGDHVEYKNGERIWPEDEELWHV